METLQETRQFGSCRVKAVVASGHVTDVFRASQLPLGRDVAIKALKPTLAPSSPFALSLEREARILSNLRHEGIARILEYGRDEQSIWITLELVEGLTLRKLMAQVPSVGVPCAVAIALDIARALAYAHSQGVIHCDVRPSNILVGRDGRIVLIDFGSAYAENMPSSPEPLDTDAVLAAPSYMSPEQILGANVDARSDVFAVGVVLYELLSGHRPFEGKDDRTLAHSVRHDEPKSLDRTTTPRALTQLVARCLQKSPNDRYASAKELCTALEDVFRHVSTSPRSHVITATLDRLRMIDRPVGIVEDRSEAIEASSPVPSVMPALRMLLLMLALLVIGGGVIQAVFRSEIKAQAQSGKGFLLLVPPQAGALLVLAQPWAEVIIDGQLVETTPFARPIPLSTGEHHVTLRHPHAPDERRTVQITAGERVILDVTMQVKRPPKPVESVPIPAPSALSP